MTKIQPETPYEGQDEDKMLKKMIDGGWKYITKVPNEEWKQLLDQIGLSDVDVDLFALLISSAAFPAANRNTQYYTETTGYYGATKRVFDKRGANRLPGVGGEAEWSLPPVKTGNNAMVFKDVNY